MKTIAYYFPLQCILASIDAIFSEISLMLFLLITSKLSSGCVEKKQH